MFGRFQLAGNKPGAVRSDAEMCALNKSAADLAFKTQKKILDRYLAERNFLKYQTGSYIRRNPLDVLEYINLQKESHGSRTFTVNYALVPMYIPQTSFSFVLGDRLGILICGRDVWWDYADDEIAAVSFQNVTDAIERFLLPWFREKADHAEIRRELLKEKRTREQYGGRLSGIQQAWLDALDHPADADAVIRENARVFRLPQKLFC